MDPLSITASIIALINTAISVGKRLHRLYDRSCPATQEFETISIEVRTFGMLWQAVLPCLEDPHGLLSDELLGILTQIRNDTGKSLKEIQDLCERFARHERRAERRDDQSLLSCFVNQDQRKNRRVRKYLSRNSFPLHRARLDYWTKTLSLVLAVVKYVVRHSDVGRILC